MIVPTQEELKKQIEYDAETGLWRWRPGYGGERAIADWFKGSPKYEKNGVRFMIGVDHGTIFYRQYYAHLLAWLYVYGYMPERLDHEDTDTGNNRIKNLREANKSQNAMNILHNSNNTSGHRGVNFTPLGNRHWRAYIKRDGIRYSKNFYTIEEAVAWRKMMETKLFGEFAPKRGDNANQV